MCIEAEDHSNILTIKMKQRLEETQMAPLLGNVA